MPCLSFEPQHYNFSTIPIFTAFKAPESMFPSKSWLVFLVAASLVGLSVFTKVDPTPYTLEYNSALYSDPKIPDDNPLTIEGIWLGRLLFHDPILSENGTQGCFSCHQQRYSFTDGQARAIGSKGDVLDRSSMPLINLAWRNQFFWDGRVRTLEDLIIEPITHPHELASDTSSLLERLKGHLHYPRLFSDAFPAQPLTMGLVKKAIAQFCYTIVSPGITVPVEILAVAQNPDGFQTALKEETITGTWIRFSETCGRCHGDGIYGNGNMLATNGVLKIDETNNGIIIPTLLNLRYTAPYMHDGRFPRLSDVFDHYVEHIESLHKLNDRAILNDRGIKNLLLPYDRSVIEDFLLSDYFTDTNIVTNPEFGNPFEQFSDVWSNKPTKED